MSRFPAVVAFLVLCLTGCSLLTDRTSSIAALTLTNESGGFDQPAYNAAIQARFPSGTAVKTVTNYVEQAGGKCSDREARLWCEIPVKAQFCAAHLLGLDVGVSGEKVTDIKTHVGGISC